MVLTKLTAYLSFLLLLFSCTQEAPQTSIAFYHWQTELAIDSSEQQWLDQTKSKRLYLKFFDVDWDYNKSEAIPKAALQISQPPEAIEIVPAVFITNRTFQELSTQEVASLAEVVYLKIQELWPSLRPTEIQIDCDWTATTRTAYFSFLNALRLMIPETTALSATIRLHQYRHPQQAGVPPVDRGMLMYYNMGDLADWTETNSILNLSKAAPYLEVTTYPLPLDLALPLFRWGVLFREGKMSKLINGLSDEDLAGNKFERLAANHELGSSHWRVNESTYLDGYYLYAGDEIRLEYITPDLLQQAAEQLDRISPSENRYLSFYHLDGELLEASEFTTLQLSAILRNFE